MGNSEKVIILLHEIYGVNSHIKKYAQCFSEKGFDVVCFNFFEVGLTFPYEEDDQAYIYFKEKIGFEKAFTEVQLFLQQLSKTYKEVYVIGFSVGATVAWLCSELKEVTGIVGYYGSRIRDFLDINPQCEVLLFYGESEKSFEISDVVVQLQEKGVQSYVFEGRHGFADPFSSNYLEKSSHNAFEKVTDFLLSQ